MPHSLAVLLTWMGDARLVAPVMLVLGWQWWRRNPRLALEAAVAVSGMIALLVVSKLAYKAAGIDWRTIGFFTISGHSALSALLYPLLCYSLAEGARPGVRHASLALGVCVALAIAVSRVLTYRHTPVEIMVGLALGLTVGGLLLRRWHGEMALPARALPWMAGALMAAGLVVWMAPHVSAERVLSHIAWRLQNS